MRVRRVVAALAALLVLLPAAAQATEYTPYEYVYGESEPVDELGYYAVGHPWIWIDSVSLTRDSTTITLVATFADLKRRPYTRYLFGLQDSESDLGGAGYEVRVGPKRIPRVAYYSQVHKPRACKGTSWDFDTAADTITLVFPLRCTGLTRTDGLRMGVAGLEWQKSRWPSGVTTGPRVYRPDHVTAVLDDWLWFGDETDETDETDEADEADQTGSERRSSDRRFRMLSTRIAP